MEILDVLGWMMSKLSCSRENREPVIFFMNVSTKTNDSCGQFYSTCCSAWSLPVPINQRERLHRPPLSTASPPSTHSRDKREGPRGNGEDILPPLPLECMAKAGSNLTTNTLEMGHFVLCSLFQRPKWKLELYPE